MVWIHDKGRRDGGFVGAFLYYKTLPTTPTGREGVIGKVLSEPFHGLLFRRVKTSHGTARLGGHIRNRRYLGFESVKAGVSCDGEHQVCSKMSVSWGTEPW